MDPICSPLALIGGLLGLVLILGAGVVVLLKLGVLAQYLFKEEEPDRGDYDLDQSREAGDQ
ncbi:MAG: hypothetical protein ACK2UY_16575 [Anaerolineae bacterium]|jgi:hypothetical protein